MYIPKQFEEPRLEVMHALIRAHPLATLVTLSSAGLDANHIPLHLSEAGASPFGVLRGHVARANPIWRDAAKDRDVLVVFQGADAYISPSWYAAKQETGKVVPTWNYVAVHAYGPLRVIDDARWIRARLEELTAQQEVAFPEPWAVADAPQEFTDKLIEGIVGIEIPITRLSGKWKVSQNQPPQNQASVMQGLRTSKQAGAATMALLVEAGTNTEGKP